MWLHAHDHSGIIHLEPPNPVNFTLKTWLDIWGIALSRTQIGPFNGTSFSGTLRFYITDWPNGSQNPPAAPVEFTGDPNTIPLLAHREITIFVNPIYGSGGNTIPNYTWEPAL